ncbi:hypothetical protein KEM52_006137 [Ascosphaera acerosa]|nr:hypothetical protein KEM52_006137 [Ascosphaera acerosa]
MPTQTQRRGPWLPEEDQQLLALVNAQGASNWVSIASSMKYRTPKQCRERFHQNLKPSLNHDPITPAEGELIERLVCEMGRRWAEIARRLGNRSDNSVKNWWNGSMNRRRRLRTGVPGMGMLHSPAGSRYGMGLPSPALYSEHSQHHRQWSAATAVSDPWKGHRYHDSYESSSCDFRMHAHMPSPACTVRSTGSPASQMVSPSLFARTPYASESPVGSPPNMAPLRIATPYDSQSAREEPGKVVLPSIGALTHGLDGPGPRSYAPPTSYERTTLEQCYPPPNPPASAVSQSALPLPPMTASAGSSRAPSPSLKDSRMSISNLVA